MTLKNRERKKGFSLVEFLIVLGILAILAVIAVPATLGIINKSNEENDKVLAATYTEYMQKFATEKVGSADFYSTVYNDGAGSEYAFLEESSGLGAFPGVVQLSDKINDINTENEIWRLIRKEACIAIKAYSEGEIADNDNYFIDAPNDKDKAFVYYYLTGKVEVKNVADMKPVTYDEVEEGCVDTEDYWVFLDREGGSGKAIGQNPSRRDFYVQIYQYGVRPDKAVNGVKVTVQLSNGVTKTANTNKYGLLVFRDVSDMVTVFAERQGAISYPDAKYYPSPEYRSNVVNLLTENVGNSPANPFVIYLKMGTLGSLELQEVQKTYTYNPGTSSVIKDEKVVTITEQSDFVTSFTKTATSLIGEDKVDSNPSPAFNPLNLLEEDATGEFKYLMYGDYHMNIRTNTMNKGGLPLFVEDNRDITSDVYGIYTEADKDKYIVYTDKYTYPVVLKRTSTTVDGVLLAENTSQLLHGTYDNLFDRFDKGDAYTETIVLKSYIYAVNKSNPNDVYYSELKYENDGKYTFRLELKDKHTGGEYNIYIVTRNVADGKNESKGYGETSSIKDTPSNILSIHQWPATITADGSLYKLTMSEGDFAKVNLQNDVETVDVKLTVYEENHNYNDNKKFISYSVELYRLGYFDVNTPQNQLKNLSLAENLTKYTGSLNALNTKNGTLTISGVKKGFYRMVYKPNNISGYDAVDEIVFIDDGVFEIVYTFKEEQQMVGGPMPITYTIICTPKDKNGNTLTVRSETGRTNNKGILDAYGSNSPISFKIYADSKVNPDKEINMKYVNVKYDFADDGSVRITFKDTPSEYGLYITSSVLCFTNGEYKIETEITENHNGTFYINRKEDQKTSTANHAEGEYGWFIDTGRTEHYQVCKRCGFERFRSSHYKETVESTLKQNDVPAVYYSAATASVGKSDANNSGHYALCTVCNKYSPKSNSCSGGSWTYEYNKYVDKSTSKMADGTTAYLLKGNSSPGNTLSEGDNGYHFKYCSYCHQKYTKEQHDIKSEVKSVATCTTPGDKDFWCTKCEYRRDEDVPVAGHQPYDGPKTYYIGFNNYCWGTLYNTYCSVCEIKLSEVDDYDASGYHSKLGGHDNKHGYHKAGEIVTGVINGTTYSVIKVPDYGARPDDLTATDEPGRWFIPNAGHIHNDNPYGLGPMPKRRNDYGCVFTSGSMPTSPATWRTTQGSSMYYEGSGKGTWSCDRNFTIPALSGSRVYYCRAVWGGISGVSDAN